MLDDAGGIGSCFQNCSRAMRRSFFGNLSAGLLAAPEKTKLRFLNSCIASIPAFRWPRWPYQDTYAERLDSTQRHMIAVLMQCKPRAEETFENFATRRRMYCGRIASKHGRWSKLWAKGLCDWSAHVNRRHDPGAWSHHLCAWHDSSWIKAQRLRESSGNESRTRTRSYRGKVHKRWAESVSRAKTLLE